MNKKADFEIFSPLTHGVLNKCSEFLTIQKNTIHHLPYYSPVAIARGIKGRYYFGFKLANYVKVLHYDSWECKQIEKFEPDFSESVLGQTNVAVIEFPLEKFEVTDKVTIYLGFTNGFIVEWDQTRNSHVKILNFDPAEKAPYRLTENIRLFFPIPNAATFFVQTSANVLIEYATEIIQPESKDIYNIIAEYDEIDLFKRQPKDEIYKFSAGHINRGCVLDKFGKASFYYSKIEQPTEDDEQAPQKKTVGKKVDCDSEDPKRVAIKNWWKFSVNLINDLKLVKSKGIFKYKSEDNSEKATDDQIYCLIAGNDSHLRIIEQTNNEPVLSWKYEGPGQNSMALNSTEDLLAIGTQDDAVLLVNLNNFSVAKFEIHQSFVTQVHFLDIHEFADRSNVSIPKSVNRIVSGSMDGSFSVIDIDTDKFEWPISKSKKPNLEKVSYSNTFRTSNKVNTYNSNYLYSDVGNSLNPIVEINSNFDNNKFHYEVFKHRNMVYGSGINRQLDNWFGIGCYYGDIFQLKFKTSRSVSSKNGGNSALLKN